MKKILILIIVVLASALYFHDELKQIISPPEVTAVKYNVLPSWPNPSDYEVEGDLVKRDGLMYQKFTAVPFTGKITGFTHEYFSSRKLDRKLEGSFKNGKEEGDWVSYYSNGQLWYKGNYKNGKKEGDWVWYHDNGQLDYKGNYKNGKKEGAWVSYYDNGQLDDKGKYKNGKQEGAWVRYHYNGQLRVKANNKNGKKEGDWVWYHDNGQLAQTSTFVNDKVEGRQSSYNRYGTVNKEWTGIFKNGKKISD